AEEDDVVFEKTGEDVVRPLAAAGLLDDPGDRDHSGFLLAVASTIVKQAHSYALCALACPRTKSSAFSCPSDCRSASYPPSCLRRCLTSAKSRPFSCAARRISRSTSASAAMRFSFFAIASRIKLRRARFSASGRRSWPIFFQWISAFSISTPCETRKRA